MTNDRPADSSGLPVTPRVGVIDSLGMFSQAARLPDQIEAAVEAAQAIEMLPNHDEIENVVVLGMGTAGLAADMLPVIAGPLMAAPIIVHKGYGVPSFIDEHTLVLALSASGDTEETIESVSDAASAGGRIVAVSSGGELARLAESWGAPIVRIDGVDAVGRSQIGALAMAPMVVLEQIGLFPGAATWISSTLDQLRRRRDELVLDGNSAERLARSIGRMMPIVYGGAGLGGIAAQRWKAQFNQNAKVASFANQLPEACHNEISGWGQNGDVTRQIFRVINLRHDFEHPQIARRFDLVNALVDEVVADIDEVVAQGDGPLAQLFDLVMVGDYVTLYRAAQEGIDPGPTPAITDLERSLAAT